MSFEQWLSLLVLAVVCAAWLAIVWAVFSCPPERENDSKSRPMRGGPTWARIWLAAIRIKLAEWRK